MEDLYDQFYVFLVGAKADQVMREYEDGSKSCVAEALRKKRENSRSCTDVKTSIKRDRYTKFVKSGIDKYIDVRCFFFFVFSLLL